jgi:hypothetical protein
MSKSDEQDTGLSRRDMRKSAGAAGMAFTAGVDGVSQLAAAAPGGANRIREENAKPGTRDWMLTNTRIDEKTNFDSPWTTGR